MSVFQGQNGEYYIEIDSGIEWVLQVEGPGTGLEHACATGWNHAERQDDHTVRCVNCNAQAPDEAVNLAFLQGVDLDPADPILQPEGSEFYMGSDTPWFIGSPRVVGDFYMTGNSEWFTKNTVTFK